jgi:3'(2'), 5'-bisphosphate nucleotidase
MTDHDLAHDLALRAGRELVDLRTRGWSDAAALGEAGDHRAHDLLMAALSEQRPGDAVLSEHGTSGSCEPGARRWIIDPLDGTREFCRAGRTDWAVHVALCEGEDLLGAVALPARDRVLSTAAPPAPPRGHGSPRVLASRSRAPAWVPALADALGGEVRMLGSAGAKVAAVLLDEADVYVHSGGQHVWDSAAPVAVARSAGLHTSRLDGSPLRYGGDDPWVPDLLVCRRELADQVLRELDRVGAV